MERTLVCCFCALVSEQAAGDDGALPCPRCHGYLVDKEALELAVSLQADIGATLLMAARIYLEMVALLEAEEERKVEAAILPIRAGAETIRRSLSDIISAVDLFGPYVERHELPFDRDPRPAAQALDPLLRAFQTLSSITSPDEYQRQRSQLPKPEIVGRLLGQKN